MDWSLNTGIHACKADIPLLEPYLQSILLMGSHYLFAQAVLES
jgi:hypothetical protein